MVATSRVISGWIVKLQLVFTAYYCNSTIFWQKPSVFAFADEESASVIVSNTSALRRHLDLIEPSPRIINGVEVEPMRYPYVAILNQGHNLKCAGVLIAPDIILTAAHCSESINEIQIGRHNRSDETEDYESLIVEKLITHPSYFRNRFLDADPHDFAIVKLYGQSNSTTPIRINRNPQIPVPDQQMHVFGWGSIDPDDFTKQSDVLRGATAYYITNEKCIAFIGDFGAHKVDFRRFVIDVTLCAMNFEELSDSCSGDSGGGLFILGREPKDDRLVGLVSAGFGCANPTLPALYARISEVHEWIRDRVCELSVAPPVDFECPALKMEPEELPTLFECQDIPVGRDVTSCIENLEPLTNITLEMRLDTRPEERGWILRTQDERGLWITEVERPIFSYNEAQPMSLITETLSVRNNRDYEFVLLDSYGDINEYVSLIPPKEVLEILSQQGNLLLSVKQFTSNVGMQYSASFTFTVGVPATSAPTYSSPPSMTMTPTSLPTRIRPFISIVIRFDSTPENIGFRLEKLNHSANMTIEDVDDVEFYELLHAVYPGSFSTDFVEMTTTITLPLQLPGNQTETYRFTMTSNEGRGFLSGGYEVWLGDPSDGDFLFRGDEFNLEDTNIFYIEPEPTTNTTHFLTDTDISSGNSSLTIFYLLLLSMALCMMQI